jgi:hypothetical protein
VLRLDSANFLFYFILTISVFPESTHLFPYCMCHTPALAGFFAQAFVQWDGEGNLGGGEEMEIE